MSVLNDLEPKKVFFYFEEICNIPHGSGNTKAISDYIVNFAKSHSLRYRQDGMNNVIIWKDAVTGRENASCIMLQGHMDMVCEKTAECGKDMDREGLDLFVGDGLIGARGTTLGGDDGIAVAMMLAVLDDDNLSHGPLECVFTVDEEVGMTGATALDVTDLKAEYMLNLDSETEGVFTAGCAGCARCVSEFELSRESIDGTCCKITVSGLVGGHSGEEINKGRANSNELMGCILSALFFYCDVRIISIDGGSKDNAIPVSTTAIIRAADFDTVANIISDMQLDLREEYAKTDRDIMVSCEKTEDGRLPLTKIQTNSILQFLNKVPNGVIRMSRDVPGLVETSSNLAKITTNGDRLTVNFMPRSGVNDSQKEVCRQIEALTKRYYGKFTVITESFAWEYKNDSKLRNIMCEAYKELFGSEAKVNIIHAGLECGIFAEKMPGLDCVSFGPDITDIHTPNERLHVESVERVWKLIQLIIDN